MNGVAQGTKHVDTHSIDWKCSRCRAAARLPSLHNATVDDIRSAIERGHERRSFDCHFKHGIKHVSAVQDGKTFRFAGSSTTAGFHPTLTRE
jgi:hypothetical protein